MKGELFGFTDWDIGRLADYPTVFSAGNVVTGKGNIVASRKHAREVSATVLEAFLGVGDHGHAGEEKLADAIARTRARRPRRSPTRSPWRRRSARVRSPQVRERVRKRQQVSRLRRGLRRLGPAQTNTRHSRPEIARQILARVFADAVVEQYVAVVERRDQRGVLLPALFAGEQLQVEGQDEARHGLALRAVHE
jgi:hypothetical protein